MDNSAIELVGSPCGHHGPYTFYKAFKYLKNGFERIVSLSEFFFVKLWSDSDLVCIGELQLLWIDKNSDQMLASLRLYFLPENTPEGRLDHGEDEVLAISEKVVLRLEDLLTWITVDAEWSWGRSAFWEREITETKPLEINELLDKATPLTDSTLDFSDVEKERLMLVTKGENETKFIDRPAVIVLSYPRYCRYRALMKRLEGVESHWLRHSLVVALGGFAAHSRNTRVLFCRDTFDYPDLEGHELLCNHLAPKLKGRPRGKRKKRSISPGGSESNESEASVSYGVPPSVKTRLTTAGGRNGLRCNTTTSPRRSTRSTENAEERVFLSKLNAFMKSHRTPIGRVPCIGYKEIDLYGLYTKVQKLGGYDVCTANRLWKTIFDELGGHYNSTSAATIMRRHYERLLLAYERHVRGEEHKPLPVSERRRLKSKTSSFSDAETSENDRSSSGKSTPVPSSVPSIITPITPSTPTDIKEFSIPEKTKTEGKISSLRSVRVKPERLRENQHKDKIISKLSTPSIIIPSEKSVGISIVPTSASSLPDKNPSNIPVTSAVAPVVEKTVPEKSVSPLEGKENIPVMNLGETNVAQTRIEADDDVIEVPYKPKTPEIIDVDAEPEPGLTIASSPTLYNVKKRKLDILKEGGLEVTAITGYSNPSKERERERERERDNIKDNRASVIQHSVSPQLINSKAEIGNLSITLTSDTRRMPPPIQFQSNGKKHNSSSNSSNNNNNNHNNNNINNNNNNSNISSAFLVKTEPPQTAHFTPAVDVRLVPNKYAGLPTSAINSTSSNKPLLNGVSPPKVLQSRSIYSYSEGTVYGNPKDALLPSTHSHSPQASRHMMRSPIRSSGEVLDLTMKSAQQKPVVEIMRVPVSTSRSTNTNMKHSPSTGMPLLDARVGSNLEITLVTDNSAIKKEPISNSKAASIITKVPLPGVNPVPNMQQRQSQKRSSSGRFVNSNKPSPYENGRPQHILNYPPVNHQNLTPASNKNGSSNMIIPNVHNINNNNNRIHDISPKIESQKQQQPHSIPQQPHMGAPSNPNPFLTAAAPLFPGYLSQFPGVSKNSPYLPVIDPSLYYSALAQGIYPPTTAPMFPPVSSVDQLQLYKELMANSAHIRFPFPMPSDALNSMSVNTNGQIVENPNLVKK